MKVCTNRGYQARISKEYFINLMYGDEILKEIQKIKRKKKSTFNELDIKYKKMVEIKAKYLTLEKVENLQPEICKILTFYKELPVQRVDVY